MALKLLKDAFVRTIERFYLLGYKPKYAKNGNRDKKTKKLGIIPN